MRQAVKNDFTNRLTALSDICGTASLTKHVTIAAVNMTSQPSYRVLIVDDSPDARLFCSRLLQKDGYQTFVAENGVEAIELARREQPHVIVMDVVMPVMDGMEATRQLREDAATATIPVIMVSAHNEEDSSTLGLDAGADDYLYKPIRPKEFRARIRSMIRLRVAQLELETTNISLERRTRVLARLNGFSESVLRDGSIDNIARSAVEIASELLNSERISILLPDEDRTSLYIAYAQGIDPQLWPTLKIPIHSPVAGRVFAEQEMCVVNNGMPLPQSDGRYETECFVSIPLVCSALQANSGTVGVLNITHKRDGRDYTDEELQICRQLSQLTALALDHAQTRRKLDETRDSIIFSLAKLSEYRHHSTGKHLERVQELSYLLGRFLSDDPRIPENIDEIFLRDLRRAAPLHDIGKVGIPDSALLKNGKLTEEEFELIKNHTRIGAETLRSVVAGGQEASFLKMAMQVAHYHHERWDGGGYPQGLIGEEIPLCARIVCLADTYDAIRMKREYKPSRTHEDATREILKASGTQFDPRLVQAYCALEEEFNRTYEWYAEQENETATVPLEAFVAV